MKAVIFSYKTYAPLIFMYFSFTDCPSMQNIPENVFKRAYTVWKLTEIVPSKELFMHILSEIVTTFAQPEGKRKRWLFGILRHKLAQINHEKHSFLPYTEADWFPLEAIHWAISKSQHEIGVFSCQTNNNFSTQTLHCS